MANSASPRHVQALKELFNKFHQVALLSGSIQASRLRELGINASPLDLVEEEHFPQYFLPMPSEKLAGLADVRPHLDTDTTTCEFWQGSTKIGRSALTSGEISQQAENCNGVRKGEPCVMDTTPWGRDRTYYSSMTHFHKALSEGESQGESGDFKHWRLHARYDTYKESCPHVMGVVHNDKKAGKPLVRSDLLCAMGLVIDRMQEDEWSQRHLIFPIMLFSFSGCQARIIHGHYDGSIFHFRYSPYYNFQGMDKENVDLFVRWQANKPIGDTAIVAPMDDITSNMTPATPSKSGVCVLNMGVLVQA